MLTDELRSIPLFANLTDDQRATLAERLEETTVDLGTVLAREGEFAYHLFVVLDGLAAVTVDGSLVATLDRGSSFGEIGVIRQDRRTANVVAVTPMRLLNMAVWDFKALAEEMPEFAAHAATLAEERLRRA